MSVDGISLTVNAIRGNEFKLTIVPHTAAETTMESFKAGRSVNLEVDVIARYLERLMLGEKAADKKNLKLLWTYWQKLGFWDKALG